MRYLIQSSATVGSVPRAPSVVAGPQHVVRPTPRTVSLSHVVLKRSVPSPFMYSLSIRSACLITRAVEDVDLRLQASEEREDGQREDGQREDGQREDKAPSQSAQAEGRGPMISIESVKYENGSFQVCGLMRHPASRNTVYETLVDYDALPRVFHNVDSCTARRGEDGKLVVSQMVGWKFLIFRGAFETVLEVVEDEAQRVLTFSLLRSAFMKEFVGDWEVADDPADGGSLVRHELRVMPTMRPPQRIGNLAAKIFETQVKCVLKDLADELSLRLPAE